MRSKRTTHRIARFPLWAAGVLLVLVWTLPAVAHRATVFAWVEGETVHTESKFGGGRTAKGATIEVRDEAGQLLLTGKTDDRGAFSFAIPKIAALEVVLKAGTGHQGSWTVPEAEIREAMGGGPTRKGSVEPSGGSASAAPAPTAPPAATGPVEDMTSAKLRKVVEEAMADQLRPVLGRLARLEEQAKEPDLKDILGGIGYIFGLAGIAAYIASRKRNS